MKKFCTRASAMVFSVLALSACQNYTVQPVCTGHNAVVPPGLTGVYTVSTQNDDFTTSTQQIEIGMTAEHRLKWQGKTSGDSAGICAVNGYIITESYDAKVQGYQQSRLNVTGMGITVTPLFYDKSLLAAAGINATTFEVPDSAKALLSGKLSFLGGAAVARALLANDQRRLEYH